MLARIGMRSARRVSSRTPRASATPATASVTPVDPATISMVDLMPSRPAALPLTSRSGQNKISAGNLADDQQRWNRSNCRIFGAIGPGTHDIVMQSACSLQHGSGVTAGVGHGTGITIMLEDKRTRGIVVVSATDTELREKQLGIVRDVVRCAVSIDDIDVDLSAFPEAFCEQFESGVRYCMVQCDERIDSDECTEMALIINARIAAASGDAATTTPYGLMGLGPDVIMRSAGLPEQVHRKFAGLMAMLEGVQGTDTHQRHSTTAFGSMSHPYLSLNSLRLNGHINSIGTILAELQSFVQTHHEMPVPAEVLSYILAMNSVESNDTEILGLAIWAYFRYGATLPNETPDAKYIRVLTQLVALPTKQYQGHSKRVMDMAVFQKIHHAQIDGSALIILRTDDGWIIYRDAKGHRPLYVYRRNDGTVFWASESTKHLGRLHHDKPFDEVFEIEFGQLCKITDEGRFLSLESLLGPMLEQTNYTKLRDKIVKLDDITPPYAERPRKLEEGMLSRLLQCSGSRQEFHQDLLQQIMDGKITVGSMGSPRGWGFLRSDITGTSDLWAVGHANAVNPADSFETTFAKIGWSRVLQAGGKKLQVKDIVTWSNGWNRARDFLGHDNILSISAGFKPGSSLKDREDAIVDEVLTTLRREDNTIEVVHLDEVAAPDLVTMDMPQVLSVLRRTLNNEGHNDVGIVVSSLRCDWNEYVCLYGHGAELVVGKGLESLAHVFKKKYRFLANTEIGDILNKLAACGKEYVGRILASNGMSNLNNMKGSPDVLFPMGIGQDILERCVFDHRMRFGGLDYTDLQAVLERSHRRAFQMSDDGKQHMVDSLLDVDYTGLIGPLRGTLPEGTDTIDSPERVERLHDAIKTQMASIFEPLSQRLGQEHFDKVIMRCDVLDVYMTELLGEADDATTADNFEVAVADYARRRRAGEYDPADIMAAFRRRWDTASQQLFHASEDIDDAALTSFKDLFRLDDAAEPADFADWGGLFTLLSGCDKSWGALSLEYLQAEGRAWELCHQLMGVDHPHGGMCSGEGPSFSFELSGEKMQPHSKQIGTASNDATLRTLSSARIVVLKLAQAMKRGDGGKNTKLDQNEAQRPSEKSLRQARAFPIGDQHSAARPPFLSSIEDLTAWLCALQTVMGSHDELVVKVSPHSFTPEVIASIDATDHMHRVQLAGGTGTGAGPDSGMFYAKQADAFLGLCQTLSMYESLGMTPPSVGAEGGIRTAADIAKHLALRNDRIGLGTIMMEMGTCKMYRKCQAGTCGTGVAAHKQSLVDRLASTFPDVWMFNGLMMMTSRVGSHLSHAGFATVADVRRNGMASLVADSAKMQAKLPWAQHLDPTAMLPRSAISSSLSNSAVAAKEANKKANSSDGGRRKMRPNHRPETDLALLKMPEVRRWLETGESPAKPVEIEPVGGAADIGLLGYFCREVLAAEKQLRADGGGELGQLVIRVAGSFVPTFAFMCLHPKVTVVTENQLPGNMCAYAFEGTIVAQTSGDAPSGINCCHAAQETAVYIGKNRDDTNFNVGSGFFMVAKASITSTNRWQASTALIDGRLGSNSLSDSSSFVVATGGPQRESSQQVGANHSGLIVAYNKEQSPFSLEQQPGTMVIKFKDAPSFIKRFIGHTLKDIAERTGDGRAEHFLVDRSDNEDGLWISWHQNLEPCMRMYVEEQENRAVLDHTAFKIIVMGGGYAAESYIDDMLQLLPADKRVDITVLERGSFGGGAVRYIAGWTHRAFQEKALALLKKRRQNIIVRHAYNFDIADEDVRVLQRSADILVDARGTPNVTRIAMPSYGGCVRSARAFNAWANFRATDDELRGTLMQFRRGTEVVVLGLSDATTDAITMLSGVCMDLQADDVAEVFAHMRATQPRIHVALRGELAKGKVSPVTLRESLRSSGRRLVFDVAVLDGAEGDLVDVLREFHLCNSVAELDGGDGNSAAAPAPAAPATSVVVLHQRTQVDAYRSKDDVVSLASPQGPVDIVSPLVVQSLGATPLPLPANMPMHNVTVIGAAAGSGTLRDTKRLTLGMVEADVKRMADHLPAETHHDYYSQFLADRVIAHDGPTRRHNQDWQGYFGTEARSADVLLAEKDRLLTAPTDTDKRRVGMRRKTLAKIIEQYGEARLAGGDGDAGDGGGVDGLVLAVPDLPEAIPREHMLTFTLSYPNGASLDVPVDARKLPAEDATVPQLIELLRPDIGRRQLEQLFVSTCELEGDCRGCFGMPAVGAAVFDELADKTSSEADLLDEADDDEVRGVLKKHGAKELAQAVDAEEALARLFCQAAVRNPKKTLEGRERLQLFMGTNPH